MLLTEEAVQEEEGKLNAGIALLHELMVAKRPEPQLSRESLQKSIDRLIEIRNNLRAEYEKNKATNKEGE